MSANNLKPPPADVAYRDETVRQLMEPIHELLAAHPGVTEFVMSNPLEAFMEVGAEWIKVAMPLMTEDKCYQLANAVAIYAGQAISAQQPLLSATLPSGERIQITVPPVVEPGTISLSIRIPSMTIRSLDEYENQGAFARFVWAESPDIAARNDELQESERRLVALLKDRNLKEFLIQAVREKKNIAVVGDTGSGKTTLMKSVCQYILPTERLITIEDVRELFLPNHENRVHLLYSKGGQGVAKVTPADLIGATMRMKPDRVLLAELRAGEAFDFLKLLTTGHSGSITSFHAESCALSYERYVFMCKEHPDAQTYTDMALKRLVALTIDIIVHVTARVVYDSQGNPTHKERFVTEVSYDPALKLNQRIGEAKLHHA